MLYLIYILIGLVIVFATDCALSFLLALCQAAKYYQAERTSFMISFKKYFAQNSDLHQRMSNLLQ